MAKKQPENITITKRDSYGRAISFNFIIRSNNVNENDPFGEENWEEDTIITVEYNSNLTVNGEKVEATRYEIKKLLFIMDKLSKDYKSNSRIKKI